MIIISETKFMDAIILITSQSALQAGRSRATAFKYFIMGFDKNGVKVDLAFHLERGAKLQELTESWLSKWETQ